MRNRFYCFYHTYPLSLSLLVVYTYILHVVLVFYKGIYRRGGFSLSTFCEVSSYPFPFALTAFCLSSIPVERVDDDSFLASSLNFPRDSCRMLLFAFHSSLPVPVQLPAKYKSLRVLGRLYVGRVMAAWWSVWLDSFRFPLLCTFNSYYVNANIDREKERDYRTTALLSIA